MASTPNITLDASAVPPKTGKRGRPRLHNRDENGKPVILKDGNGKRIVPVAKYAKRQPGGSQNPKHALKPKDTKRKAGGSQQMEEAVKGAVEEGGLDEWSAALRNNFSALRPSREEFQDQYNLFHTSASGANREAMMTPGVQYEEGRNGFEKMFEQAVRAQEVGGEVEKNGEEAVPFEADMFGYTAPVPDFFTQPPGDMWLDPVNPPTVPDYEPLRFMSISEEALEWSQTLDNIDPKLWL